MYRKLTVYQKSMSLTSEIYKLTNKFPKDELFGLISQMKRSSVSIPSNIAEGSKYQSKQRIHFIRISLGSAAELRTQVEIADSLNYIDKERYKEIDLQITEIMKMLSGLLKSLK